ncbi:uncharacterized protein LOC125678532 isoform X2 [Ostrea edulis]|uniref:uncharacterized protein LOC125678532 isoform X2 n=1 Tax=Ostrea edulis TaxID=37623 RepID=UPI00209437A3|nr:uncharacterized protein LOC125678532 isoform X2 [Ostrea edulis]
MLDLKLLIIGFMMIGITVAGDGVSNIQIKQISQYPAIAGYSYSLLCSVVTSGNIPQIDWRFSNGTPISENEMFRLEGNATEILTIKTIKQSHTGLQFICSTTDLDNSTATSQNYTLIVIAAPEIQFTEDLVYTQTGKSFYKDCVALGYPFPVVEWYQINKEVPQMKISVSHSRLVVQNIVPGLHENYTCKASVSSGDFVLWTNKTFTLISYGVRFPDEEFTDTAEYKYTIFAMVILGCVLMLLVLTVISCRNAKNGNRAREKIKKTGGEQDKTNKFKNEKDGKCSGIGKKTKPERYIQLQKENLPDPAVYDEIRTGTTVNNKPIPELPTEGITKTKKNIPIPELPKEGSKMTKTNSEPSPSTLNNTIMPNDAYDMPMGQSLENLEELSKKQSYIYEDIKIGTSFEKSPKITLNDPMMKISSAISYSKRKTLNTSSDSDAKALISSSDSKMKKPNLNSDPQMKVPHASSDARMKAAIECSDSEMKVPRASSDPRMKAAIECSDSEMKVPRASSDPRMKAAIECSDSEMKVPRASSDPRMKAAIECSDSEMKVPRASSYLETPNNTETQHGDRKLESNRDPESIYHL